MTTQQPNISTLTKSEWLSNNPLKHGNVFPTHGEFKLFTKGHGCLASLYEGLLIITRRTDCRIHYTYVPKQERKGKFGERLESGKYGNKIYTGSHFNEYFNLGNNSVYPRDLFPSNTIPPDEFAEPIKELTAEQKKIVELEKQLELVETENNTLKAKLDTITLTLFESLGLLKK